MDMLAAAGGSGGAGVGAPLWWGIVAVIVLYVMFQLVRYFRRKREPLEEAPMRALKGRSERTSGAGPGRPLPAQHEA